MTSIGPVNRHALLTDGRAVRIRTVQATDKPALLALNPASSERRLTEQRACLAGSQSA